jgi:hypothetical protein
MYVLSRYILEKFAQTQTQTYTYICVYVSTDSSKKFKTENNKFLFQIY